MRKIIEIEGKRYKRCPNKLRINKRKISCKTLMPIKEEKCTACIRGHKKQILFPSNYSRDIILDITK